MCHFPKPWLDLETHDVPLGHGGHHVQSLGPQSQSSSLTRQGLGP